MKLGWICRHIWKKMEQKQRKNRCALKILLHVMVAVAQTAAFLSFCHHKGIQLCPPKWKRKWHAAKKELCEEVCCCEDGNCCDSTGVSDATRPEECEGIQTAEGAIGQMEQSTSKKRSTANKES